jgi:hypothetical protein
LYIPNCNTVKSPSMNSLNNLFMSV